MMTEMLPAVMRRQLGIRRSSSATCSGHRNVIGWTHDERLIVAGGDQKETPFGRGPRCSFSAPAS